MDEIDKLHLRLQGIKQKDVAARSGVSVATLSNLLNRKTDPKMTTIARVNEALDLLGAKQA